MPHLFVDDQTVVAIATPPGQGGVAIVRVSGNLAEQILRTLFIPQQKARPAQIVSHHLYFGKVLFEGMVLDECLCVLMRAPHSYTGEDVLEFHLHGGRMPATQVIHACIQTGARIAQPGEFTRRAFMNGKMDLSQAEAVMDLITSSTENSAHAAIRQLQGELKNRVMAMQDQLTDVLAEMAVAFDYPEENIETSFLTNTQSVLQTLIHDANTLLEGANTGRILREGIGIAILGKPNVGKSSLFNALLQTERAIVTDIPGTTRDMLEENLNIDGLWVRIIDTAGIRQSFDEVETIGIDRAKSAAQTADLSLFVLDVSTPICAQDREIAAFLQALPTLVVLNKTDQPACFSEKDVKKLLPHAQTLSISCQSGAGISTLKQTLQDFALGHIHLEDALLSHARHVEAMENALACLQNALTACENGVPVDCLSVDMQAAWHHLGAITGQTVDEAVFDRVFERFCLGK